MRNTIKKIAAMLMISGMLLTPCFGSEISKSGTSSISTNTTSTTAKSTQSYDTVFENFDQKANQLFNILSTVLKSMKEMSASVTRNML